MGTKDSRIQTSAIPQTTLQTVSHYTPQQQPHLLTFGPFYKKHKPEHNKYKIIIQSPIQQSIISKIKAYKNATQAFEARTQNIIFDNVITDNQLKERYLFQCQRNKLDRSITIRPFKNEESKRFASILYEIHISEEISKINSKNLHKIVDKYIIPLNIEGQRHSNSVVLEMEKVDISLSQIISYRRQHKIDWAEGQFSKMINDLIDGLSLLHQNNITHNAIRPSNIYFSSKTNEFLLGSFSSSIKRDVQKKIESIISDGVHQEEHDGSDLQLNKKKDVEDLGIALLSAFYLCQPIDRTLADSHNMYLSRRHDSLKVVLQMITPQKYRRTAEYLKSTMAVSNFQYTEMNQILKKIHEESCGSVQTKEAIGWGYLHLGKFNEMTKSYDEISQKHEQNSNVLAKAENLQRSAKLQKKLGQLEETKRYGKLASNSYQQIADTNFNNKNYLQADNNYKKSIKCLSKYGNGQCNQSLKHNIDQLQKIQVMNNPNSYLETKKISNAKSKITSQIKGDFLETCQLKVKEAMLDSQHGAYESSEKLYNESLQILRKSQEETPQDREMIKAEMFTFKAENSLRWAQSMDCQIKRGDYLTKTEADLRQSLLIYQRQASIGQCESEIALKDLQARVHLYKLLGELNFKQQDYHTSIDEYNKGIQLANVVQKKTAKPFKEKGDLFCGRGTSNSFQGNCDIALKDYEQALAIYAKVYGSNHNAPSAIAIGNLGRVYINQGQEEKAKACLSASQKILKQVKGQQDPDYLHFKRVEKNFDQYRSVEIQ